MSEIKPIIDEDGMRACSVLCQNVCEHDETFGGGYCDVDGNGIAPADKEGRGGCLCRPYYARQAAQSVKAWVETDFIGRVWFVEGTRTARKPVLIIPDDERDER